MRGVALAGAVAGIALALWFNVQRTGRAGSELYMNHLFPPAFRIARPKPVDSLIDGLAPLQSTLDRKAREPAVGDGADSGGRTDDEE